MTFPAPDAWSRPYCPDILCALMMLKNAREGIEPDQLAWLARSNRSKNCRKRLPAWLLMGDVVGTGSSRKSATNSVLWFMGDDIPHVPNKRGGLCLGGKLHYLLQHHGRCGRTVDGRVEREHGHDVIDVYPFKGEVRKPETGELLASFELKTEILIGEVQRWPYPLIIGRGLTTKARKKLPGLPRSDVFNQAKDVAESSRGFSGTKWLAVPVA